MAGEGQSEDLTWEQRVKGTPLEGMGTHQTPERAAPPGLIPLTDDSWRWSPTMSWNERIKGTMLDPNASASAAVSPKK